MEQNVDLIRYDTISLLLRPFTDSSCHAGYQLISKHNLKHSERSCFINITPFGEKSRPLSYTVISPLYCTLGNIFLHNQFTVRKVWKNSNHSVTRVLVRGVPCWKNCFEYGENDFRKISSGLILSKECFRCPSKNRCEFVLSCPSTLRTISPLHNTPTFDINTLWSCLP